MNAGIMRIARSDSNLYAATNGGLYVTTDTGALWTAVNINVD